MCVWGLKVQKFIVLLLVQGQFFLILIGNNRYKLYRGIFVILRFLSSLILKDLFQNGLVLRGWWNFRESFLFFGYVVEVDSQCGNRKSGVDFGVFFWYRIFCFYLEFIANFIILIVCFFFLFWVRKQKRIEIRVFGDCQ